MKRILAALALAAFAAPPVSAGETARSISVSATHKLELAPNEAILSLSMQHEGESAEAAEAKRRASADAIRKALAAEGRNVIEIRDDNIRMNAREKTQRVYAPDGKYENVAIVTYTLSGDMKVVSDAGDEPYPLSRLLPIDGVSQIQSPVYRAYVPADAMDKARERSVEEANAKARDIARSYGLKLGKPSRINIADNIREGFIEGREPGQLMVQATASITFDLVE